MRPAAPTHGEYFEGSAFAGGIGIPDAQAHEEAVELGLRERVSAVVLDGILRGDHHEGTRQGMRAAVDRDLAFIHRFEQGGLGLGRGAVDLVGQQEVAEDGAGLEFESLGVGVVDGDAEDIAGQHVAGELQAMEAAGDGAGKGLGESGLADAGDILDEEMAARQQAHERKANDFGLAVNRRADGRLQF